MNDMTLEQMQQRLSELKLEKARRAQMRANGTPSPTVMGWASAAAGDPTMLMSTKQLRDQQALQAAESALQRKFQEEQNELNRQNTIKLAEESKNSAREAKEDEWMKGYNIARNNLSIINQKLSENPNDLNLKQLKGQYEEDLKYYAKKLGRDATQWESEDESVYSGSVEGTPQEEGFTNEELKKNIDEKLGAKWTDKNKKEVIELISQIKDPAIQEQYMTKVEKKGKTAEEQAAATSAAINNAVNSKDASLLPKGYYIYAFEDPTGLGNWVATNDANGKPKKVKKW